MGAIAITLGLVVGALVLYILRVNHVLSQTPPEAEAQLDPPMTREHIEQVYKRVKENGINWTASLPSRRDRRYVIAGGSGLVGSHIALFLLDMGVPPQAIRLLDIRAPAMAEFSSGAPSEIPFIKTDITSEASVADAFNATWDDSVAELPLTVFHTAAVIRPFERYPIFYHRCHRVNVLGTAHVLAAAREAGAGLFIYTSSSNAGASAVNWVSPPWIRAPRNFVQTVGDDDYFEPMKPASEFPTNYAVSKAEAERLVCAADGNMRTAAIRPGNGVYGHRNDRIIGHMLEVRKMPSFSEPWAQTWVNVRNVALGHLLLESALLGEHADKVAGRPFMVSDGGAPLRYRDLYKILSTASSTGFQIIVPPPILLFILAYCLEIYCLLLAKVPFLQRFLREPSESMGMLQPGTISSASSTFTDCTSAKRAPADGGIGYRPVCTTLEGLCAQLVDWNRAMETESGKGS
ncbi:hypothetical protein HIM_07033 [Hirsutella minnesotensis 3608]|uniref:3-beta hydroxysteroid dehydrogenase/isomerase domain-containing protein n=1 Tax=Hirsutella minnesotensis 3608 TaxID=1043627 RepID=A0A0F7ZZ24_9HYPO|nr:hypothetical protein HIM_07033 [Hirsutella minnesotensis 3608]